MRRVWVYMLAMSVGACGAWPDNLLRQETATIEDAVSEADGTHLRPKARPSDQDRTPVNEETLTPVVDKSAKPRVSGAALGSTVASLGNPTESGLWLKTPLISAERPGRVVDPNSDQSTPVTLIPLDGPETAGSRISLRAMQALNLGLTDLPTLLVYLSD